MNSNMNINKRNYKHGESKTKLYHIWQMILQRCINLNDSHFEDYGGRGITICPEWANDYIEFRDWSLSHGYAEGLQINRIENNGNYEPSNCNFVTSQINNQNQRTTKLSLGIANEIRVKYDSGYYTQQQLAKKYGVNQQQISNIINNKTWRIK